MQETLAAAGPAGNANPAPGNHHETGRKTAKAWGLGIVGLLLGVVAGGSSYYVVVRALQPPPRGLSLTFSTPVRVFLHQARCSLSDGTNAKEEDLERSFKAIPRPSSDNTQEQDVHYFCEVIYLQLKESRSGGGGDGRVSGRDIALSAYRECIPYLVMYSYVNIDKSRQELAKELSVD